MVTIGVDPHKQTHTAAAVNDLGVEVEHLTAPARPTGNGQLLEWARAPGHRAGVGRRGRPQRVRVTRAVLDRPRRDRRAPSAAVDGRRRRGARTRGSLIRSMRCDRPRRAARRHREPPDRQIGRPRTRDPPAGDVSRAAAGHAHPPLQRAALAAHDLWPDFEIPAKALTQPGWQTKVAARLRGAEQTIQVTIARDMIRRARELSRATKDLYDKIAALVKQVAPQLLAEPGIGVLLAAKFIGEIAGIDRFTSDAQLARMAGCAPIPVSSGRTDRHRLDPGGNRRLNSAFYMLAIIRIRDDPRTAVYLAKQRANGKTKREAIRNLKRHLVRRVYKKPGVLTSPARQRLLLCVAQSQEQESRRGIR